MALNETRRPSYGLPTSSSAQRTRVSRASPLPPSGERSNAVIVMVIVRLVLDRNHRLRGRQAVKANPPRLKMTPLHVWFVRIARACRFGLEHVGTALPAFAHLPRIIGQCVRSLS